MKRCFIKGLCFLIAAALWVLGPFWVGAQNVTNQHSKDDMSLPTKPHVILPNTEYSEKHDVQKNAQDDSAKQAGTSSVSPKSKGIVLLNPAYSQSELPFPWMYPWTVEFETYFTEGLKKLKRPDRGINYQSSRRFITEDRSEKHYKGEEFPRLLQYGGDWDVFVGEFEMICNAFVSNYDSITNTTMVLCSYLEITPEFQKKYPRITGVTIVPSVLKTMRLAMDLAPRTREMVVITDDVDRDPDIYRNLTNWVVSSGGKFSPARRGESGYTPATGVCDGFKNCKIKFVTGTECTTQEMLKVVKELPPRSLIVFSNWRNFHRDGFATLPAVIYEINQAGHPLFTVSAMPYPEDAVGGYISQGKTCAQKVTKLVEQIIDSPKGTVIPALRDEGECVIDMNMMRKYGLKTSKIPSDALILNPILPIWEAYRSETLIAAVTFSIVIFLLVGLFILYRSHVRYARRTETLFSILPVRIYAADAEGKVLFRQVEPELSEKMFYPKRLDEISGLDIEKVKSMVMHVLKTGDRATAYYDFEHKKRLATYSRVSKDVFGKDAVMWVSQDVTAEYLLRDQVNFALESLRYATELADISCFHCDSSGYFVLDTSSRVDASNWGMDQGKSIRPELWVYSEDLEKYQKGWSELMGGRVQELRLSYRSEYTGVLRYYSMIAAVRHEALGPGSAEGKEENSGNRRYEQIFGVIQDITVTGENERKLEAAMKAAEAADRAKSYFIATMSHELRTPLNSVIGFSELLQMGDISSEEQKEYLKSIHVAGNNLLSLVNDLLDLSKIEADQLQTHPKKTDLKVLLNQVYGLFKQKAESKRLEYQLELAERMPMLYVDDLRLRQVLINLLGNAFKFTHQGMVGLSAKFVPEYSKTGPSGMGTLIVRVSDTGVGIKKEYLERVFEPFVQEDEGGTRGNRSYEGTGLGLTISRRMVRKMGGELSLSSQVGKGSVFTIELKNIKFNPENEKMDLQKVDVDMVDGKGCQVLLVDDVETNLQMLDAMLKRMGFSTKIATSGKKALEILNEVTPEFVMTDLWMPEMTGAELAAKIREDDHFAHTKIVAITADIEASINFNMQNFDGAIFKPLTLDDLKKFINTHRDEQ